MKDGRVVDSRKLRLKKLRKGEAWEYMLECHIPLTEICRMHHSGQGREAASARRRESTGGVCPTAARTPARRKSEMTVYTQPAEAHVRPDKAAEQPEPLCGWRLRGETCHKDQHALCDAALIPNLGLELEFARNYSASVNWMYAWWSKMRRIASGAFTAAI